MLRFFESERTTKIVAEGKLSLAKLGGPHGRLVAVTDSMIVTGWDFRKDTSKQIFKRTLDQETVKQICWSTDSHMVAILDHTGNVIVLRASRSWWPCLSRGDVVTRITGRNIKNVTFSPSGHQIALISSTEDTVSLFETGKGKPLYSSIVFNGERIIDLGWIRPDGPIVVLTSAGILHEWSNGQPKQVAMAPSKPSYLKISNSGKFATTYGEFCRLQVWHTEGWQELTDSDIRVTDACFHPSRPQLAVLSRKAEVDTYDISQATSSLSLSIDEGNDGFDAKAFSLALNRTNEIINCDQTSPLTFSLLVHKSKVRLFLDSASSGDLDKLAQEAGGERIAEILHDDHCCYNFVPKPKFNDPKFESVSSEELQQLLDKIKVIIFTTTPIEQKAFLDLIKPIPGRCGLIEGSLGVQTYRIGLLGRYLIAHTNCAMGASATLSSSHAAEDVLHRLRPKAIIVVGIAFGFNSKKHRLGDVVIADAIFPYDLQRVSSDGQVTPRGRELPCTSGLVARLVDRSEDWSIQRGNAKVKVLSGLVMSGETLVDNLKFRDRLLQICPTAIAGEMEGKGFAAATHREDVKFVLVKAICDWADGNKNKLAQPFAAHCAADLVTHVLSKPDILDEFGISEFQESSGLKNNVAQPPLSSALQQTALKHAGVSTKDSTLTRIDEKELIESLKTGKHTNISVDIQAAPSPNKSNSDPTDRNSENMTHRTEQQTTGRLVDTISRAKVLYNQVRRLSRTFEFEDANTLSENLIDIIDIHNGEMNQELLYECYFAVITAKLNWALHQAELMGSSADFSEVEQLLVRVRNVFGI